MMSGPGFIPLITHPTRPMSYTLIDNIFTNVLNRNIHSGLFTTYVSDHLLIFAFCCKPSEPQERVRPIQKGFFTENLIENFKSQIASVNWGEFLDETNSKNNTSEIGLSYSKFLQQFTSLYNSSCPYKEVIVRKRHRKAWITTGLKKCLP